MRYLIKKAGGTISYSSYSFLNMVFYKKKEKIIFISFPDATDNSWHLYCYALANLIGYEFVWLVNNNSETVKNKILSYANKFPNDNKTTVLKRWSVEGLIAFSSARFVFHTHGTYYFVKKSLNAPTIINLWHGMPIKAIGHLDKNIKKDFCYSDYTIASSEYYREIMSKAFDLPINKVLGTGLPRNDVLFKKPSQEIQQKLLSTLLINPNDKLVVWLPTYRASKIGDIRNDGMHESFLNDLDNDFLSVLNDLSLQENIKIFIKLHPMDKLNGNIHEYNFSNILFFDSTSWPLLDIELYDLISISNGIISDFSSVMIDCIPTNIPIGFLTSSENSYTRKTVFPIEDISQYINYINKPADFIKLAKKRTTPKNKFNNFGGNSCNKIFKELGID